MLLHRHPRYIQLASQIRTHISENPDTEIQDIDKLIKQVSETVAELVL
jgi:hypothetical protein